MMTNIAAVILGAVTIICLAAFRVSQKRKKIKFRNELISKFKDIAADAEKEEGR